MLPSAAKRLKSGAHAVLTASNFSPEPSHPGFHSGAHRLRPPSRLELGGPGVRGRGARSGLRSPGQETRADPTHLRLHVQLRATRVREVQWGRTGCLGSRAPRSLARSRRRPRAPQDPAAATSEPHPPLLNSNGCHHTHLAPHAGTNRRGRHN